MIIWGQILMGVLKPNKVTLHFLSVFCFLLFCFLCFILNHFWFVFLSLFDCSFVRPPVRPFVANCYHEWVTTGTNKASLVILSFIVTEKVWESDSTDASDEDLQTINDPPVNNKRPSPAKKPNKKAHTDAKSKSTKQASLTSFFKKSWKILSEN